jgi:hypothetical protein
MRLTHRKAIFRSCVAAVALCWLNGYAAQDSSYVDDCESGTSYNKFRSYWYVFDDNAKGPYLQGKIDSTGGIIVYKDSLKGGNSKITNITKVGTEYSDFVMTKNEGQSGVYGARVDFQMGTVKPEYAPTETYGNYVGVGTGLIGDGQMLDLRGATKITFWAKGAITGLPNEKMLISTSLNTNQGLLALYASNYQIVDTLTSAWRQYTMWLAAGKGTDSLAQPSWAAEEEHPIYGKGAALAPLNLAKVTGLEWSISVEENAKLDQGKGTIWIDNIVVHNYKWSPFDACMGCVKDVELYKTYGDTAMEFSTVSEEGANFLDQYFYAYNDAEGRKVTKPIVEYSYIDTAAAAYLPADSTKPELKLTGHGQAAGDTAAWIKFTLGPKFTDTATIGGKLQNVQYSPFVGLGSSLAADDGTSPYNADSAKVTGVYFEYQTKGTSVDYIAFQIQTTDQLKAANADLIYHVLLPATGGAWKSAMIPFSALKLPELEEGSTTPPAFKSTAITRFEWSYEGAPAQTGEMAIDNIYLLKRKAYPEGTRPMMLKPMADFQPQQVGNHVVFALPATLGAAEARLVTVQGRTLATMKIDTRSRTVYSLPLSTTTLAKGMYFVVVATSHASYTSPMMIVH